MGTYYIVDSEGQLPREPVVGDGAFVKSDMSDRQYLNTSLFSSFSHNYNGAYYEIDSTANPFSNSINDSFSIDFFHRDAGTYSLFSAINFDKITYDIFDISSYNRTLNISSDIKTYEFGPNFDNDSVLNSIYFNGNSGAITTENIFNSIDSLRSPFSVDFFNYKNQAGDGVLFVSKDSNNNSVLAYKKIGDDVFLTINNNDFLVDSLSTQLDSWYHNAVTFDGSRYHVFVDGIEYPLIGVTNSVDSGEKLYTENFDVRSNILFECLVTFPTNQTDCTLFELGDVTNKTRLRLDGLNNLELQVGASDQYGISEILISTPNYPKDGLVHNVSWDINVGEGTVRLFIDNVLISSQSVGGPLSEGKWANDRIQTSLNIDTNSSTGATTQKRKVLGGSTEFVRDNGNLRISKRVPISADKTKVLNYMSSMHSCIWAIDCVFPTNLAPGILMCHATRPSTSYYAVKSLALLYLTTDNNGNSIMRFRRYYDYRGITKNETVNIPASALPTDGAEHTVIIEFKPAGTYPEYGYDGQYHERNNPPPRIYYGGFYRIWIDDTLVATMETELSQMMSGNAKLCFGMPYFNMDPTVNPATIPQYMIKGDEARNWEGEVNEVRFYADSDQIYKTGFEVSNGSRVGYDTYISNPSSLIDGANTWPINPQFVVGGVSPEVFAQNYLLHTWDISSSGKNSSRVVNGNVYVDLTGPRYNPGMMYLDPATKNVLTAFGAQRSEDNFGQQCVLIDTNGPIRKGASASSLHYFEIKPGKVDYYFDGTTSNHNPQAVSDITFNLYLAEEEAFEYHAPLRTSRSSSLVPPLFGPTQYGYTIGQKPSSTYGVLQIINNMTLTLTDVVSVLIEEDGQAYIYKNGVAVSNTPIRSTNSNITSYKLLFQDLYSASTEDQVDDENEVQFVFNRDDWIYSPNVIFASATGTPVPAAGAYGFGYIGNGDSWEGDIQGNLSYYPGILKNNLTKNNFSIGSNTQFLDYSETGLDYANDYVNTHGGLLLQYDPQTSGYDITNAVDGIPQGSALVLPAGHYYINVTEDTSISNVSRYWKGILLGKDNVLLAGATNNPADVIIEMRYYGANNGTSFIAPIFSYGNNINSEIAYLTVNRFSSNANPSSTSSNTSMAYLNTGGKAYRVIFDNNNRSFMFHYQNPYMSSVTTYENCTFKNYSYIDEAFGIYEGDIRITNSYFVDKSNPKTDNLNKIVQINNSFGGTFDSDKISSNVWPGYISEFRFSDIDRSMTDSILGPIFEVSDSISVADANDLLFLKSKTNDFEILSYKNNGDLIVENVIYPTEEMDDINWQHIQLSYNNGEIKLRRDGELVNTVYHDLTLDSCSLFIGYGTVQSPSNASWSYADYTGQIKGFRIYNDDRESSGQLIDMPPITEFENDAAPFVASNAKIIPDNSNLIQTGTISETLLSPFTANAFRWFTLNKFAPIDGVMYDGAADGFINPTTFASNGRGNDSGVSPVYIDSSYDPADTRGLIISLNKYDDSDNPINWTYEDHQNFFKIVDIGDDDSNKSFFLKPNPLTYENRWGKIASVLFTGTGDSGYPNIQINEIENIDNDIRINVLYDHISIGINSVNTPRNFAFIDFNWTDSDYLGDSYSLDSYHEDPLISGVI